MRLRSRPLFAGANLLPPRIILGSDRSLWVILGNKNDWTFARRRVFFHVVISQTLPQLLIFNIGQCFYVAGVSEGRLVRTLESFHPDRRQLLYYVADLADVYDFGHVGLL
jgi:hypothetical protein